jgi:hypothetical protein
MEKKLYQGIFLCYMLNRFNIMIISLFDWWFYGIFIGFNHCKSIKKQNKKSFTTLVNKKQQWIT